MLRICTLFVLALLASPANADFIGTLRVIDGDTFDVGTTRVRLFGVDAVELDQPCFDSEGDEWACGTWVRSEVVKRYQGKLVHCQQGDVDRYGRVVASCSHKGRDIASELVQDGIVGAYAKYSSDYLEDEKAAAVAGRGLWASTSMRPSEFRSTKVKARNTVVPEDNCVIKGNISTSGKIYHMPHNRDYAKTRISVRKGEQWFCTETEAHQAGWRAARN